MKAVYLALCATLLLNSFQAAAGVVVGGTRLVYPGGKKEATITVKPGRYPLSGAVVG